MATPTRRLTVELHVRSLAPPSGVDAQQAVIDQLRTLDDRGVIADHTINVWGRQVGLSTTAARTDAGRAILDRIAAFREWANDTDRSLEQFFRTRESHSSITGESIPRIVLPALALAEYRDGELVHVTPHRDGDTTQSVDERLETLKTNATATEKRHTSVARH